MKALIHDDKVVDVKEQSYEVHPSMSWICLLYTSDAADE